MKKRGEVEERELGGGGGEGIEEGERKRESGKRR